MRRPLPVRTIAAALVAMLALAPLRQVLAGGGCPHHDHQLTSNAPAGSAGHAAHSPHSAAPVRADQTGNHSSPTPCTCVGSCQAGTALVLTVAAPRLSVPTSVSGAAFAAPDAFRSDWILTFLPYGTAPPSTS